MREPTSTVPPEAGRTRPDSRLADSALARREDATGSSCISDRPEMRGGYENAFGKNPGPRSGRMLIQSADMDENREYDVWNALKKKIQSVPEEPAYFPQEGEAWMCSLGKNIGNEQNGSGENFSRPVLVIKKFNNRMFWCAPLSTKQKRFDFYFNFTDPNGQKVSVILAQLKLMSVKRLKRKLYEIEPDLLSQVKEKLCGFLE